MYRFGLGQILLCGLISPLFVEAHPLVAAHPRQDNSPPQALPAPYQNWLDQDVVYIITDEERAEFVALQTDQQRDKFIEDFWQRRNPHVTPEWNPFKEEHYSRIAYANEQFAAKVPGWKTDRGRIYIIYGQPDEQEQHPPRRGPMLHSPEEGPWTLIHRTEVWRYDFIQGLGRNVFFDFVDKCDCGEYHLVHDPTKRRSRTTENKEQLVLVQTLLLQHQKLDVSAPYHWVDFWLNSNCSREMRTYLAGVSMSARKYIPPNQTVPSSK